MYRKKRFQRKVFKLIFPFPQQFIFRLLLSTNITRFTQNANVQNKIYHRCVPASPRHGRIPRPDLRSGKFPFGQYLLKKCCKLLSFCDFNAENHAFYTGSKIAFKRVKMGNFSVSRGAKWGTIFACQKSGQTAWEQPDSHSQLPTRKYSAVPINSKSFFRYFRKIFSLSIELPAFI